MSDGRVLRYQRPTGFTSFAFTSPNRTIALCDGTTDDPDKGPICGRPFGLAYNPITRQLYIADAYYGHLVADSHGGLAKQIATGAEGQPFVFCNGLDIDPVTRNIYFTDTSAVYDLRVACEGSQLSTCRFGLHCCEFNVEKLRGEDGAVCKSITLAVPIFCMDRDIEETCTNPD